jgi:4'-phosphopantetheinyl transferase
MTDHPLLRPGPLPGVSVAWVDLDAPPVPLSTLDGWLSPDERERAGRFRFEIDRCRYVAARGILRSLLASQVDVPPSGLSIDLDPFGKPRLGACHGSDLRFNVSHTAGRALYAFASRRELGVDAEVVRPIPDMDSLARQVFTAAELAEWLAVPRPDRVAAFFNGWTRKEAFVKALGHGLSFALDRFEVSLALEAEPRLLRVDPEAGPLSRWSLSAWQPEHGHRAALVVENR